MKRFILRKEYFGGLIYDRLTHECRKLSQREYQNLRSADNIDVKQISTSGHSYLSGPTKVFLGITNACNLHCIHCSTNSGYHHSEFLTYQEIAQLLNEFDDLGVFEIGLNGGEPLCHPEFFEITHLIKSKGYPIFLNTNGIMENEDLIKLSHANIDKIKISVDGLERTNDRIRGKGTFAKAVSSIKYLKNSGCDVRINFTLSQINRPDLFGIIDLSSELGCDVKISPLVNAGRAKQLEEYLILGDECTLIVNSISQYCSDHQLGIDVEISSDLAARDCTQIIDDYDFRYTPCGMRSTHVSIDSDGTVYPTGKQTDFDRISGNGNIFEEPFINLWRKIQSCNEALIKECGLCNKDKISTMLADSFTGALSH